MCKPEELWGSPPETVVEAVERFVDNVNEETRQLVRQGFNFNNAVSGRSIRERCGLKARRGPLHQDAIDRYGLANPKDVSGLILAWATARLCETDFDPIDHVRGYGPHWKRVSNEFLPTER